MKSPGMESIQITDLLVSLPGMVVVRNLDEESRPNISIAP